jgi:hypothetical protein
MVQKTFFYITLSLICSWNNCLAKQYALITKTMHDDESLVLLTKKTDDTYWSCPTFEASTLQESITTFEKETVSALTPKKIETVSQAKAIALLYVDYIMGKAITIKCRTRNIARDWTWVRLEDIEHALASQRSHEKITLRTIQGAWIQLSLDATEALKTLLNY